jgi:hypothetical protein
MIEFLATLIVFAVVPKLVMEFLEPVLPKSPTGILCMLALLPVLVVVAALLDLCG